MKRTIITSAAGAALQAIYPRVCPVCGEILTKQIKYKENEYICKNCIDYIDFMQTKSRCMRCSKPLDDENAEFCDYCSKKKRQFDLGVSLMLHNDASRKIIYDLKFNDLKDNANFLARESALKLKEKIARWRPQAIVPVPLHKSRLRKRGYNQASVLARFLSKEFEEQGLEVPVDEHVLARVKKTKPQKELNSAERDKNISSAFEANNETNYERLLLLDDIYTTGATLNECARALKSAGVKEVYFVTMSTVG